jgi:dihydrofolate reductase
MQFGLIDEFWLFVNPVLLGNGIPVFDKIKKITKLKLIASHAFSTGVVWLHYERN